MSSRQKLTIVDVIPFSPGDIRTVEHADIGHAISAIPDSELSRPLSPELLAELANRAWREASSYPDYDGVPFPASNPLTGLDIQTSLETSPGLHYPSVGDFVNPELVSDIRAAQLQLGHRSLKMTEHYVRERKGDKVEPTR